MFKYEQSLFKITYQEQKLFKLNNNCSFWTIFLEWVTGNSTLCHFYGRSKSKFAVCCPKLAHEQHCKFHSGLLNFKCFQSIFKSCLKISWRYNLPLGKADVRARSASSADSRKPLMVKNVSQWYCTRTLPPYICHFPVELLLSWSS